MLRLRTQIAVVAVLLAGSGVALLAELGDTCAVVFAAGVVLLWLTLCLASASAIRRECAVELIAGGRVGEDPRRLREELRRIGLAA